MISGTRRAGWQVIAIFALLFMIDMVPSLVSRVFDLRHGFYTSDVTSAQVVLSVVIVCLNFIFLCILVVSVRSFLRIRITIPDRLFLVSAIALTLYLSYKLNGFSPVIGGARYTSGGFSGLSIFLYSINLFLFYFCVFWYAKIVNIDRATRRLIIIYFLTQLLLVDGVGPVITFVFAWFIYKVKNKSRGVTLKYALGISSIIVLGTMIKFYDFESGELDREYWLVASWVISRFSIKHESLLLWINGESYTSSVLQYYSLLCDSFTNRLNFIFGTADYQLPRSISESIYIDLYGIGGSGSSPGFAYGLVLSGFGGILIPIIIVFFMKQYFADLNTKLGWVHVLVFAYMFGQLFTNIFEIQILVSPSAGMFFGFVLASLLTNRLDETYYVGRKKGD